MLPKENPTCSAATLFLVTINFYLLTEIGHGALKRLQGPVPERRNNSIPGINVPYFRDNFIPGINSVPERRNNAIKGINLG